MKYLILLLVILSTSCQTSQNSARQQPDSTRQDAANRKYSQLTLKVNSPYPTVGITTYTLITENTHARQGDAEAIMKLKIEWPRAMQAKDEASFNRILAQDFTFRGEQEFYGRDDYIRDRVGRKEVVASAQYENLVLQFFSEAAVLTYRNVVKITDAGGKPQTLHMTWADVFVKEGSEWKIGASHLIDMRVENQKGT